MNHIYKTIYNESLGTWVAVPEIAKSKGKKSSGVSGAASALGAFSSIFRLSGITLAVAMALGSQSAFAAGQYNSIPDTSPGATGPGITNAGVTNNGQNSMVIGVDSGTQVVGPGKPGAVAIGYNATTGFIGKNNGGQVALGGAVHATGDQSIAIGNDTDVTGHSSIGIGGDDIDSVSDSKEVPWGGSPINDTKTAQDYKTLTGQNLNTGYRHTTVSGQASIAIGVQSQAKGDLTTVLGTKAFASDVAATALGIAANASGAGSIALGAASKTDAENAIAIGTGAQATGEKSISIGYKNQVGGVGASAIGDPNINNGKNSHVQGNNNFIASDLENILLLGNKNVVGGQNLKYAADGSLQSGDDVGTGLSNSNSVAVGNNNNITRANVFILGSGINTDENGTKLGETIQNSVYLGADSSGITANSFQKIKDSNDSSRIIDPNTDKITSVGTRSAGTTTVTSATINGVTYGNETVKYKDNKGREYKQTGFAGASKTKNGIVTVGYSGGERRIQNVAAGLIDPLSTDAINGSQLYIITKGLQDSIDKAGGGIKYFSVKSNETGNQKNDGAQATDAMAIGPNASATAASSIAIGTGAQANAEDSISIGHGNIVSGEGSGAFGDPSINQGKGSYTFGNDNIVGNTTTGAFVLGSNNQIAATSTAGYDSKGKLVATYVPNSNNKGGYDYDATTKTYVKNNAGTGGFDIDPNSSLTSTTGSFKDIAAVGNRNHINSKSTYVLGSGINTNNDAANLSVLGKTVENSVYLGDRSIAAAGAAVGTKNKAQDGSDGTTTTAGNTGIVDQATVGNLTYSGFAGAEADGVITVGASGNERRIQNVAAGEISATSTDAINGSQLYAIAEGLAKNAVVYNNNAPSGTSTTVIAGNNIVVSPSTNPDGSKAYTVSTAPKITLDEVVLPNPAGGNNVVLNGNGLNNGGYRITNVGAPTAPTDAANKGYVDNAIAGNRAYTNGRVAAAKASAAALANLLQVYQPGKSSFSAAIGHNRSTSALAIGYSTMSDNGKWVIRGSASVDKYDTTVGAGVSYFW